MLPKDEEALGNPRYYFPIHRLYRISQQALITRKELEEGLGGR